jgi:hypothetical protein
MLRGARIDLESAQDGLVDLDRVYARDLHARTLSDDAIRAVNTVVRSVEGAMGKTADAVAVRFATNPKPGRRLQAYFPLADNPAEFANLREQRLPGVAVNRPDIAAAFERHQPYQPGRSELGYLKQLYRENHHHDFTLQETRSGMFTGLSFGGAFAGVESGDIPTGWRGVLIVDGMTPLEGLEGASAGFQIWADWHFKDPPVSVAATLMALVHLGYEACEDVSVTAGL